MKWLKKVIAPAALVVGLGVAAVGFAQPADDADQDPPAGQKKGFDKKEFEKKGFDRKGGAPGFEKKADPKTEPQPERRGGGQPTPGVRGERGERSDPAVDAWVSVLVEKITDPHDTIRDSARGALAGVGRPALPALERLANGNDGAKAVAAKKVIAMIEHGPGRPGMGGPPMGGMMGNPRAGGMPGGPPMGRPEGGRGPGEGGPGLPGGPGGGPGFGSGFPGGPMGPGFGPGGGRGPGGPMGPGATPPGGGRPGAGPMGPGGGARPGPGGPGEPPMPPGRPGGRGPGEGDEIPPVRPM